MARRIATRVRARSQKGRGSSAAPRGRREGRRCSRSTPIVSSRSGRRTVVGGHADEEILVARVPVEQAPRRARGGPRRRSLPRRGQAPRARCQPGRQRRAVAARPEGSQPADAGRSEGRSSAVGTPSSSLVQCARLAGEQFVGEPRTLPLREVGVLKTQLRQRRGTILGECLVERADLSVEDDLRPLVEHDVVDDDLEDVVRLGEPDQLRAEEPCRRGGRTADGSRRRSGARQPLPDGSRPIRRPS